MKRLIIVLCAVLSMSFAKSEEAAIEPQQSCHTAELARANATSEQLANQVLCCCPVGNGGSCCKYQSACIGGFVNGCFCTGHSIESEPVNSKASVGMVRS